MTIRNLQIFESVARLGKMSAAANELFISQPTISQAVLELEREYGVLLFNRLSKKLYITEEGKKFLEYTKSILFMVEEMDKSMKELSTNKRILLGSTITVGKCVLVDIIKKFEQQYPHIEIKVIVDNTTVIEKLLLSGKIDIALVEGKIKSGDLIAIPSIPDKLVLVCHKNHPLARKDKNNMFALKNCSFVLREEGSGTREALINKLKEYDININIKWSCHGFDSIIEAVLGNQGVTMLSERIAKPYVDKQILKIIPIEDIEINRNFSIVYHKNKIIMKPLSNLIELIEQCYSF
jgi:DNA-binding transcriptional LysR family regulator